MKSNFKPGDQVLVNSKAAGLCPTTVEGYRGVVIEEMINGLVLIKDLQNNNTYAVSPLVLDLITDPNVLPDKRFYFGQRHALNLTSDPVYIAEGLCKRDEDKHRRLIVDRSYDLVIKSEEGRTILEFVKKD